MYALSSNPKVSIFMFCKNAAGTIQRSIDSVLGQTYQNIEFVVQDGDSTDGTLEILRIYGDRIKLLSAPDSGPSEAFLKAMRRCSGEIVGSCLADEELLPDAVEQAVRNFTAYQDVAATIGDAYNVGLEDGVVTEVTGAEFDFVGYLMRTYVPHFSSCFFRRDALIDIELYTDKLNVECLEAEIWIRLGIEHRIKYFPGFLSRYGIHSGQLSNRPARMRVFLDARIEVLEGLFSESGFLADLVDYKPLFLLSQVSSDLLHLDSLGLRSPAHDDFRTYLVKKKNVYQTEVETKGLMSAYDASLSFYGSWVFALYRNLAGITPPDLKQRIPQRYKEELRSQLAKLHHRIRNLGRARNEREPERTQYFIYHMMAQRFEKRGQIEKALELWERCKPLGDPEIDGLACQALMKQPGITNAQLLKVHKAWARRHCHIETQALSTTNTHRINGRRIRIGYLCGHWSASYIAHQVMPFIRHHNREAFEVFGFSRYPERGIDTSAFTAFFDTQALKGIDFVNFVRDRETDLLVELTGFSPGHRIVEMSHRCAPVQVCYINHNCTSGAANIDYVLADEIAAPRRIDAYFSERIYRLPGCFFCFNYDEVSTPPVAPVPATRNGFVTFGCFAHGAKINDALIRIWCQILERVQNSRLFIRNKELSNLHDREFMKKRFGRYGIKPERLTILGGADRQTILENYAEVDISLDTSPYCGGQTTSESLWQGVPVVSLKGETFAACYGASILDACGLSDLVANTKKGYVDIAVCLASDLEKLKFYREHLREMSFRYGFRDITRFTRNLEEAFFAMLSAQQDQQSLSTKAKPSPSALAN